MAADAWICPACDHILDTSFLNDGDIHEEKTRLVARGETVLAFKPPDAVVELGNVNVASDEFAGTGEPDAANGRGTPAFMYFSPDSSNRAVHPDAVPVVVRRDDRSPRSEYEDALLLCIDGRKSVREIQRASGLAAQDVVVNLLTLIDKGAIRIPESTAIPTGSRRRPRSAHRRNGSSSSGTSAPEQADADAGGFDETLLPGSLSDVWADESSAAINAAGLIEDEVALAAESGDSEFPSEVAAALEVAEGRRAARTGDGSADASRVAIPKVTMPTHEELVERLASNARHEPLAPAQAVPLYAPLQLQELSEDDGLPPVVPSKDLNAPEDVANTKELPIPLNPQFLTEVEPSKSRPASKPGRKGLPPPTPTGVRKRAGGLPAARAPIQERDRREPRDRRMNLVDAPSSSAAGLSGAPTPAPTSARTSAPTSARTSAPTSARASAPTSSVGAPDRFGQAAARSPAAGNAAGTRPTSGSRAPARNRSAPARGTSTPSAPARAVSTQAKPARGVSQRPAPANTPPPSAPPTPARDSAARDGVDNVRMVKAQKLYEQALKDKSQGNLVSARMNMKLALTFDPTNDLYMQAFEELNRDPKAKPRSISSLRSEARSYYEQATEAERHGDVDRAIAMLEKAIQNSRRAPFLNRLGVILAMKKREFIRAQALIEEAIELVPTNTTYERNLQKVLSMAAAADVTGSGGGRKGGLFRGLLGRKKSS